MFVEILGTASEGEIDSAIMQLEHRLSTIDHADLARK
jgi:hypothetical protein